MESKTAKFLLTSFAFLFSTMPCYAEGQKGLDVFVAIVYLLSFFIYTIVGGVLIRMILKVFKLELQIKRLF